LVFEGKEFKIGWLDKRPMTAYLKLAKGKVVRTLEVVPGKILMDVGRKDKVLGVEFLM
jgi:uncharacterized protein YuzE